jgi:serine/threonine protein kinase
LATTEIEDLVKLTDFGFAKELDSNTSMLSSKLGTQFFAAPEILFDEPYGRPADIFSLGTSSFRTEWFAF